MASLCFGTNRMVYLFAGGAVAFATWPILGWHGRGLVLALLGAATVPVLVFPPLRIGALLRSGTRVQGTVVGVKPISDDEGTEYHPVVQFTTVDGRPVVFTGSVGHVFAPMVGRAVPVRYRPDDPDRAEVDRPMTWMMVGLAIAAGLLAGLGLLVAAVVVYRHG